MKLLEIETIEYFDYNGKVYDLTVDVDETYNINGVIVPNKAMEFKLRVGDKKVLTIQMTQFHKNFYSFISPPSLTTFVNNDGLSLIFLLLEYFYQLLSRLKRKSYPNTEEILKIM